MSRKIDPREVLKYLNELGYTNISAQQLKDFILDLKKIIKYEHIKRKSDGHAFVLPDTYNYSTPIYGEPKLKPQNCQRNDIFEILHNHPTYASKAKMVNKIDRQIAIHITRPKKKNIEHDHCIHLENNVESNYVKCTSEKPLSNIESTSSELLTKEDNILQTKIDSSKRMLGSELSSHRLLPTSKQSAISSSIPSLKFKKSKTAVLRNTSSAKSLKKSDPVALYHQYQEEWKNIKFPGEDNHLDLRWAVREKLINGPPVEQPLRKCNSMRKVYYF